MTWWTLVCREFVSISHARSVYPSIRRRLELLCFRFLPFCRNVNTTLYTPILPRLSFPPLVVSAGVGDRGTRPIFWM